MALLITVSWLQVASADSSASDSLVSTIPVYSVVTQRKIADVPSSARYRVLSSAGTKVRIQFVRPTVTGWVSADFVDLNQSNTTATVAVNALNFRAAPTTSSAKLTQVYRGFESQVVEQSAGFVKIYAPVSMPFFIDRQSGVRLTESNTGIANWNIEPRSEVPVNDAQTDQTAAPIVSATEVQNTSAVVSTAQPSSIQSPVIESSALEESNHLLAPGDSISLLVFGEPDLSVSNVRVPQGGRVSFPLIGSVAVLGKTTSEVEKEVAERLSEGYVRNPRLSVSIFSYRPIFIRGEVKSTGSFPYSEGLTIAKAVALAGGVSASANATGVSITRDGVVVAEGLSSDSRVRVASGDIVSVAADQEVKDAESSFVYLHGEVAQPGAYEFQPGLTVEKAVVLAGGFTLRASTRKINVSRYESVQESGEPLEMKRVKLYTPVKPGDVIKVGASWF